MDFIYFRNDIDFEIDVPEWARLEHMETSRPLCELWGLSNHIRKLHRKK